MSTTSNLQWYKDATSGGAVKILGHLVFYTVTGERVPHAQAVQSLRQIPQSKIGSAFPQNAPKDVDVFRRVSSSVKRSKVPTSDPNIVQNVLIRNVGTANGITTKRVVVEDVSSGSKVLDFSQEIDLEFNGVSGLAQWQPRGASSNALAVEVAEEVLNEYYSWRGCLNSYAVREWIRAELVLMGATAIKRGVYFVSAAHTEALDQMTSFVAGLPGNSMFHTLPLVDNETQRRMLEAAYEEEAQTEMDNLMVEINTIVSKKKNISQKGRDAKVREAARLVKKMEEYKGLLNTTLAQAQARSDLLQEIMDDFLEVPSKRDVDVDEDDQSDEPDEPDTDEPERPKDDLDELESLLS